MMRVFLLQSRGVRPTSRHARGVGSWATVRLDSWDGARPHAARNLLRGEWVPAAATETVVDAMNGEGFLRVPATSDAELAAFGASLRSCGKTGLHNPFRNVDRYVMLGRVCAAAAVALREPSTNDYFTRMIQRTSPKSYAQAKGEVDVWCVGWGVGWVWGCNAAVPSLTPAPHPRPRATALRSSRTLAATRSGTLRAASLFRATTWGSAATATGFRLDPSRS